MEQRVKVAVVGIGGWGKNLARNYFQLPESDLRYVCDLDERKLEVARAQMPGVIATDRIEDILEDAEVQALVIATTAPTHYKLCDMALDAGKDVYVEKPFVLDIDDATSLISKAAGNDRILMVGHLLEYHPVIDRLKQMITDKELGDIYYIYSQRVNLGTVRGDENAMWNFAPHDVSVILYLLGKEPTHVTANGQSYLQSGIEDVVFITLNFADQSMAHIHVSWLDPHKIRRLTIVGSNKMAVFDDLEANEKLRIYDKGAQVNSDYSDYAEYVGLRFGDITVPYMKMTEPLSIECRHFLDCVRTRSTPLSDGEDGLRVLKVLDAAQRSLAQKGSPVSL